MHRHPATFELAPTNDRSFPHINQNSELSTTQPLTTFLLFLGPGLIFANDLGLQKASSP